MNRANAVKEALVEKYKLDPNRFAVDGLGWDRPADPNDPYEPRQEPPRGDQGLSRRRNSRPAHAPHAPTRTGDAIRGPRDAGYEHRARAVARTRRVRRRTPAPPPARRRRGPAAAVRARAVRAPPRDPSLAGRPVRRAVPRRCACGIWWWLTRGETARSGSSAPAILPSPRETFADFHSLWFDRALTRNTLCQPAARRAGLRPGRRWSACRWASSAAASAAWTPSSPR